MPPENRKAIGKLGEQLAVSYFQRQLTGGMGEIVETNWRCRSGELDLIVREQDCWVFVEVRTRSAHGRHGSAAESVNLTKQRKIRKTAEFYMMYRNLYDVAVRFDVIAITLMEDGVPIDFQHYRNAF